MSSGHTRKSVPSSLHLWRGLDVGDATFIPMSALNGDNVVEPSANMPWYQGGPLRARLESLPVHEGLDALPLRMPIQYVVRPHRKEYHDYRGYAGSVASGVLRLGRRVRFAPSGMESVITTIEAPWGAVEEAYAPDAVTVQIADDLDVTRGEMICGTDAGPVMTQEFDAVVCWMDERTALRPGKCVPYQAHHAIGEGSGHRPPVVVQHHVAHWRTGCGFAAAKRDRPRPCQG